MKVKYKVGQRLSFIARNKCTFNGCQITGKLTHYVGYVKQIRRSLFGVRYVMIVSKSDEIHIVSQRDIMGVVEKREDSNKTNKSNENANI